MAELRPVVFAEQRAIDAAAVLAFWRREEAMPEDVAQERIAEVHMVGVDRQGAVGAVTSRHLRRNEQLRMPVWYYRVFVGAAHRRVAENGLRIALAGRDDLDGRFVRGEDMRAGGIVFEFENRALEDVDPRFWELLDFAFIGVNEYGEHVRVHYFPGALAPPPQGRT